MRSLSRTCLSLLPPLSLAAALLLPGDGQAQIRRCTDAHGNSVYTDRECSAVGGVDRLPRGAAQAPSPAYSGGCARNLRALVGQITAAIDARDSNKLAAVYHWAGMSDAQAYAAITRLEAVAQRPLLDIAPVMPAVAEAPPAPAPGNEWTTLPRAAPNAALAPLPSPLGRPGGVASAAAANAAASAGASVTDPAPPAPAAPKRRAPVALRLEQTLANGVTPSRTVFGLTRHYGCWWIKG